MVIKNYTRMSDYAGKFQGRPAAVLGGGPSLPSDMERLPANSILIAVNYHALKLCQADFMVFNDEPERDPEMMIALSTPNLVKVSPGQHSDIEFDVEVWTGFSSANTAAWLGLWMGCDPVILCGMDLYQSSQVYFHPHDGDQPSFHYPLDMHIRPWIEDGRNLLPHVERLRAMSGPLVTVFGQYQGKIATPRIKAVKNEKAGKKPRG